MERGTIREHLEGDDVEETFISEYSSLLGGWKEGRMKQNGILENPV